jgi:hypothetical protein
MKDQMVCCYKYHVELDMLKEALNKFVKQYHCKDCTCACPTYRPSDTDVQNSVASKSLITSITTWLEGAFCPIAKGKQWHRKKCLMHKCKKYGVKKLKWCTSDFDGIGSQFIEWQTFWYIELDKKIQ